jgi:hypothetical protein
MQSSYVLLLASSFCGQAREAPEARPALDNKIEAARANETKVDARRAAESYTITGDSQGKVALKFEAEPLLQWSNHVNGSFHGSVFIWTAEGRPEVIASIYKKYVPPPHLGVEFHTLSAGRVTAERDGRPEWTPGRGVDLVRIPGGPVPGESPAQRLRQMRALARELTATKTDRRDLTRPLRLLTQPVYRYQSGPEVIDGALFAFVEGTDPEIILQIEARRGDRGPAWFYRPARMQNVALRIDRRGRELWSVPTLPWQKAFDPREPYTLLIFRPGEGVNPPDDRPQP